MAARASGGMRPRLRVTVALRAVAALSGQQVLHMRVDLSCPMSVRVAVGTRDHIRLHVRVLLPHAVEAVSCQETGEQRRHRPEQRRKRDSALRASLCARVAPRSPEYLRRYASESIFPQLQSERRTSKGVPARSTRDARTT